MDMHRTIAALMALSLVLVSFVAPALAQAETTMMPVERSDKDLMSAMMDEKDISIPTATMKTAGMEGMMSPGDAYTLFVASDNALTALNPGMKNMMVDKVKDRQTATGFVKAHLAKGMVLPDDVTGGKLVTLMNGRKLYVRMANGRMMVDDAGVIKAVKANNGIVYVMDKIPSSIMGMMKGIGMTLPGK